jgi:hypothetical protein
LDLHFIWINFISFGFKQFLRALSLFAAAWHCKFLISICFCFRITRLLKRSEKSEAFDQNVSIFHLLSEKATTEFKLKCIILKALKKKNTRKSYVASYLIKSFFDLKWLKTENSLINRIILRRGLIWSLKNKKYWKIQIQTEK